MSRYKFSTTVISVATLAACVPPTYYADDDLDIVCSKDASVASHIKDESCRLSGDIAIESGGFDQPRDNEPFQNTPITPKRSAKPAAAEGKCGGDF